ncbi:MAG: hypothetical protein M3Y49_03685 [Actinomycetota bacterium]|nr:hypothetical protein [Actinomycetota bacterium]
MWTKKGMIDKQARFWVLLGQGCTLIAACDAVGVDRVTGRRWRKLRVGGFRGRSHHPRGGI